MQLNISIDRTKVYETVAQNTVYIGGRSISATDDMYDKVFTTDDDRMYLDHLWKEVCQSVDAIFPEFLTKTTPLIANPLQRDNAFEFTLTLPNNINKTVLTSIESDFYNFVSLTILAGWLSRIGIESATLYQEEAKSTIESIQHKIYSRKRPVYNETVRKKQ